MEHDRRYGGEIIEFRFLFGTSKKYMVNVCLELGECAVAKQFLENVKNEEGRGWLLSTTGIYRQRSRVGSEYVRWLGLT